MKLLIDMNLPPRWVQVLQAEGIEARHWSSIGPMGALDREIMAYAAAHGLVVLTHDLDFSAMLAATGGAKPSVVQIRAEDVRPEAIGPALVAALRQMAPDLEAGALVTVEPKRARLRLLPLRG